MGAVRRPRRAGRAAGGFPRRGAARRAGARAATTAALVPVPARLPVPRGERQSTQEAFGRLLGDIAAGDSELARRIVTTSPDVTVSTNLGAWVNRRGIFDRAERADTFREEKVVSAQRWAMSPQGQHIELGIAESNLFLQLAALGLAGPLFGARLLPIGTLYDPFIKRGLDALNYALLPGCALHPGGDAVGDHPGARGRRPPIGRRAADRPGAAGARRVSSRPMPTSWPCCCAGRLPKSSARTANSVYFRLSTRPIEQPRAPARCGPRRRDHRRRLLAARTGAGCGSGDRLLRRGRPRGARRL